jgi:hypothetical protein
MTPQEFKEVETKFKKEEARWKSLKVGQTVYEEFARSWEMEYFEIEITEIHSDERFIMGIDKSQENKLVKLHSFCTIEELKNMGITFK